IEENEILARQNLANHFAALTELHAATNTDVKSMQHHLAEKDKQHQSTIAELNATHANAIAEAKQTAETATQQLAEKDSDITQYKESFETLNRAAGENILFHYTTLFRSIEENEILARQNLANHFAALTEL